MAFFKKLKERLFKSSSKIDEGLEAIVSDGGEAEALAVDEVMHEAPAAAIEILPEAVDDEPAPIPAVDEEAEAAEAERSAIEAARAQEARIAEAARVAEKEADRAAEMEAERAAALKAEQDAAEKLRLDAADQAQRDAAEAAQQRANDLAEQQALERASSEAAQREEREAIAQAEREAAQQAERDAQETAVRAAAELAAPAPILTDLSAGATPLSDTPSEPATKPGLLGRLMGRAAPKTVVRRTLDDEMLEQLEELLIAADMGVDTALRVTANMAEGRFGKKLSVAEIKQLLAQEIARIMEPVAKPLPLYAKTPQVVLVVGVNGSGKTTTIGKLASQFRAAGKKVVIAAGDTFRAAAVEQLQVWGERAGVPVLTAAQGSDPASLAFDAMTKAEADGADLLLIDTAGRLQNRGDLMEELAKIVRVIRKKDPSAPHNTLLVLDATTGQNALNQVKVFQEISDVSGLVMTKLDGTAKGGVLVALADKFGLPIHAIGVGEQIDDLSPFDPDEFADALVGLDR